VGTPFRRRFLNFLKSTFVGGLFVLAPLVVLLILVGKAVDVVYSALRPLFEYLPFHSTTQIALAAVLGVASVIVLCFLAGLVARTALTRRLVRWIESMVLSNLPGYSLMKGVGASFVGADGSDGRQAVLVRLESSWTIGFAMDRLEDSRVVIFIPGAPNAFSGALHIMEANRIEPLNLSIRATIDCLNRLGVESAQQIRLMPAPEATAPTSGSI
jgi:uncharacterized membrane protein